MIHKGQSMSGYYRIINKSGGYTWVQTCATLICNNSTSATSSQGKPSSNNGSANNSAASANNGTNANNNNSNSGSNVSTPVPQEDLEQSVICVNYVLR